MVYVPDTNYACYVVQSEDTIRAYETIPRLDTDINYRDYYIHSDYMYKDGTQTFSRYGSLPVCIQSTDITDNYYYRVDFPDILIMFTIFVLFCFYVPWKIICRLFRRLN